MQLKVGKVYLPTIEHQMTKAMDKKVFSDRT